MAKAKKYKGARILKIETTTGDTRYQVDRVHGGRRCRKNFPTREEAREYARREKDLITQVGNEAFELSKQQREDATSAIKKLAGCPVTLQQAADYWIKQKGSMTKGESLRERCEQYIAFQGNKGHWRDGSVNDFRKRMNPWNEELGHLKAKTIDAGDIEAVFTAREWKRTNAYNYLRHLSMLYSWLMKKGYADTNPTVQIELGRKLKKNPAIWKPAEVRRIMAKAEELRPAMVPYMALAFFGMVRPEELCTEDKSKKQLRWEDLDFDLNTIHISVDVSKTHEERELEMLGHLRTWLVKYRKGEGEIFPFSYTSLGRWRREIYREAKVKSITDGARHTGATYTYALYGLEKSLNMLRHQDSRMLKRHYENKATNQERPAKEFFEIAPDMDNIIAFEKTA